MSAYCKDVGNTEVTIAAISGHTSKGHELVLTEDDFGVAPVRELTQKVSVILRKHQYVVMFSGFVETYGRRISGKPLRAYSVRRSDYRVNVVFS